MYRVTGEKMVLPLISATYMQEAKSSTTTVHCCKIHFSHNNTMTV